MSGDEGWAREEAEFLAAVASEPDDDAVRLVYADRLEERGDERAEYLRLECELAAMSGWQRRKSSRWRRFLALGDRLDADWSAQVARGPIANCPPSFAANCPRHWSRLPVGSDPQVRTCPACGIEVHFCRTIVEAVRRSAAGKRIVVDIARPRDWRDVAT